ncbi:MAG TPA: type II toxin-antitoxin system death-on-curing family toxin [Pyrinomonadaceae bacterium]|nr:type II toxin-antitoxin system death-on-curing family toxin [Pyrinomonadaceae bacterium]
MRYLSLQEVISLHSLLIAQSGGSSGLRDRGALESAVAQPEASFGGEDLYPELASKAAALGHSMIQNHPFVDGNKRVGHGAIEVFLLPQHEIDALVDEQEKIIIEVASGKVSRVEFSEWISKHMVVRNDPS